MNRPGAKTGKGSRRSKPRATKPAEKPMEEFNAELDAATPDRPRVDPEVAAMRAYEEARRPKRAPEPAPPPPHEDEPEVVAARMAERLMAQEYAQRQATAKRRAGIEPAPEAQIPMSATPRVNLPDITSQGKEFVRPGYVSRWVRLTDDWGRPTNNPARLANFQAWGATPVLDADGKEIRSNLGILMEMPPERYAARSVSMAPTGAHDRNVFTNAAHAAVEQANSAAGRELAQFVGAGAELDRNPGGFPEE